jgi:hypothetical protein
MDKLILEVVLVVGYINLQFLRVTLFVDFMELLEDICITLEFTLVLSKISIGSGKNHIT